MDKKETAIHILLVEDESGHVELIRRTLETTPGKYILAVASTILEARQSVISQRPDLALVDYSLPDGHGDLIIALGKDLFPVVMLTSHGDEQLAVQAIKAGALDYVTKSAETFDILPHVIDSALREWQLIQDGKKAELELIKLSKAIDNSGEAIFQTDNNGIFTRINPGFTAIYGYTADEVVGKHTPRILKSGMLEKYVYDNFWKLLLSGEEVRGELVNKTKGGRLITVEGSASPIQDENKTIIGFLGMQRDITERKKTEEKLRQLSRVVEQSPVSIVITDLDGTIQYVNPKFNEVTGYSSDEVIGRNPRMLKSGYTSREEYERLWKTIVNGGEWQGEFHNTKKDKSHYWESAKILPMANAVGETTHFLAIKEDITVRKLAEDRLRESDIRYRELIETMPDGVYRSSHEGKFLEVNPAMVKILGYTSKEELIAIDIPTQLYFAKEDRESAALEEALEEMAIFRLKKKDGSEVWVEDNGRHILDDDGRILYHEGILRDITERKRAEDALRRSESKHGKMVANIGDIIVIIDRNGINRYKSPNVEKWFGWKPEELVGVSTWDNIYPEDVDRTQNFLGSLMAIPNATGTIECRYKCKNGRYKWIEFTGVNLLHDPDIMGILGNYQDITDRRHSEETLRASEETFRRLFKESADPILILSDSGFTDCNQATVALLGYRDKTEFLTKQPWEISPERQPDGMLSSDKAKQMLVTAQKQGYNRFEWIHIKADGTLFSVEVMLTPITIRGENHFYTVWRDITERKKSEETLRQVQKMESIGTLAGGIAHDFNNLLVGILGQSDIALKKLPKDSPAIGNIIKAISASERAADLTRQLLAYSGKGKFFIVDIDLNTLVKENVQLLEISIPKNAQLRYDLSSLSPHISGDVGQIQQVIMNLIINAGEALGSHQGLITLRTNIIELSLNDNEYWKFTNVPLVPSTYALLEVSDTGSGISEETLTRIFDPFFTTKFTGRGLGLAAVLGIIRGHNGGLSIVSKEGKGTTFKIVLPLIEQDHHPKQTESKKAQTNDNSSKTILVIDDDPSVIELLNDLLTDAEFQIISALNPFEGIDLYRTLHHDIDLVILDYSMPGMDGKEAFEELLKINSEVKVLLSSGYTEESTLAAFGAIRPSGFFQKPYKMQAMLDQVSLLLNNNN